MIKETKERSLIIEKYTKLAKQKNFHPSGSDLKKAGITRDKIRHHFATYADLKKAAKAKNPEAFENIVDEGLFTPKAFEKLTKKTAKHDRYVVTTAVEGCKVHNGFYDSITNYNGKKDAMLLVLPSRDPAANVPFHLDPKLANESIVFDDIGLNDNIFVSAIKISAKQVDPITGLSRLGQRNGSFIYASPKQRMKLAPTSNKAIPHALMTTGAITKANYTTKRYMSNRTAYIADNDHVMGAIVVEVQSDHLFHFRQVQADKTGNFIDLGVQYNADGTTKVVRPEALVLGDWHSGETDPAARKAFIDSPKSVMNVTKPKRLIIHDGFNGRSVSHHEIKNKILRAQRAAENQLDLREELMQYAKDLESLAKPSFIEEVVIVHSNHDEFLDRYLAEGRYIEDAQNHSLALELAEAMIKGHNPVQYFVEHVSKVKNTKKIRWLKQDEDFKIAGIELGAHGHKGSNGSKGNANTMEQAYGNSVSGHTHTAEILRGAWIVGTTSLLQLNYNEGPSSWIHSSALVYPNGSRQLINVIEGLWRLE